jgi:hypothetical protein
MKRNTRYVPLLNTTFVPLVACLWPVEVAQRFLEWTEDTTQKITRADDGNAGRFMRYGASPLWLSMMISYRA